MAHNKYPKGSEWRKWDLHMHCPEDVLQNQFDGTNSDEKWGKYLSVLESTDLEVLGITNYFCIKGYQEILRQKSEGRIPKIKLILPNIEFRISPPNKDGNAIDLHVIFSDKVKPEEIQQFLNRLPQIGTTPEEKNLYCSEENLRGKYGRALVDFWVLEEHLKNNFKYREAYLIFGVATGLGSLRPLPHEGRGATLAEEIDKKVDAFFGSISNVEHLLNVNRYEGAIPKPVVAGSSAHQLEMIGANFSWIKADPTFEGLKQIIFEPRERIKIQEEKPEEKKTYFFIDKARFIDNSTAPNFPSDFIELNQNITAVIGGRSTGKSLLMHYIAKTIDKEEVTERLGGGNKYNFDENPNFNFEVVWGDGKTMQLKNPDGGVMQEEGRKILYIPQNYLNRLSEIDIKSKDTLNRFVIDVLIQDEKVGSNYQTTQEDIKRLNKEIPPALNELFSIKAEIEQLEEELKQLGDPKGIESYIKKLEKEALDIKGKSGLSDEEIKTYESLTENEKLFNSNLSNLNADRETIGNLHRDMLSSAKDFLGVKNEHARYLNDPHIIEKFKQIFQKFETLESDITNASQVILKEIDEKIKENKSNLSKIKEGLAPLTSKIKLQAELEKKMASIKVERGKLNKIALHQKTLKLKSDASSKKRDEAIGLYGNIFSKYEDLRNEFKKYENKFEDIALSIVVGFNEPEFNARVVDEFLNKQTLKKSGDVNWRDEFRYQYDPVNHVEDIIKIFNGILNGKVGILKHRSRLDAITKLLENRFFLDFGITYKDDQLDKMSPGKKGLVLLKLLIELSNDEWPILLDQPDDDLDNRSIYADLVSFLLKKKKDRQIIVVTHNPNLVVGADAEEAIVANQAGQETGRENRMFRFEYISGALENTFELAEREEKAILFRKGIRQHVCEVLEGGKEAFQKREQKYSFSK